MRSALKVNTEACVYLLGLERRFFHAVRTVHSAQAVLEAHEVQLLQKILYRLYVPLDHEPPWHPSVPVDLPTQPNNNNNNNNNNNKLCGL